jgi:hypothetical protein
MGRKVLIDDSTLYKIAQAIREVTNSSDKLNVNEFSNLIDSIIQQPAKLNINGTETDLYGTYDSIPLTITDTGDFDLKKYLERDRIFPLTVKIDNPQLDPVTAFLTGKLKELDFEEITKIDNYLFQNQSFLTKVNLPNCSQIGEGAFRNCFRLNFLNLSSDVKNIGTNTFANCSNLTSANFPECTYIGSYAFADCLNLTEISFPKCLSFASSAFKNCYKLEEVNLPNCHTLDITTFTSCSNLKSLNFPVCCSVISSYFSLSNCSNLRHVNYGVVPAISSTNFSCCKKLESLYLLNTSTNLTASNAFYNTPLINSSYLGYYGSIYVPSN